MIELAARTELFAERARRVCSCVAALPRSRSATHTLGLGENPPSSGEITRRVNGRCQWRLAGERPRPPRRSARLSRTRPRTVHNHGRRRSAAVMTAPSAASTSRTPHRPDAGRVARGARLTLALLLSAAGIAYGGLWARHTLRVYDVLSDRLGLADDALAGRVVELGFDIEYRPHGARGARSPRCAGTRPPRPRGCGPETSSSRWTGGPSATRRPPLGDVYLARRPGDGVELDVVRDGGRARPAYRAIFRERAARPRCRRSSGFCSARRCSSRSCCSRSPCPSSSIVSRTATPGSSRRCSCA